VTAGVGCAKNSRKDTGTIRCTKNRENAQLNMPMPKRMHQTVPMFLAQTFPSRGWRASVVAWTSWSLFAVSQASAGAPPVQSPARAFQMIDAVCDVDGTETGPKGQFICQYVCRDRDHTKLAIVYSNSGSGQCRSPISRKIKQFDKSGSP
jgi:hypothetical protein